ncbi:Arm DNA-binding domain-containing protein [Pseudomonas mosselii]|uniref:Arm DNA-binding domain-containing protein n=1 Tax=Pseudomonas mosselii TaxID=78327 RepID=UPI000A250197|nr:Arm DNA-binding domain-containing protein [Pseudomonas mosselii]MDH1657578.1 Arm DNA-binding domain-containing protein [Pseudomonas mosselii]MDH1715585.1 Arm DNA-binding domain-containing protein [Pseudomonas mosselii]MDH1720493.1 Arm DNA-binding domain-containing protein [Pseudomonas mosselii]MEB5931516.1 Arm DNA-binding domain-containing protein [Pseudomonas mosselii]ORT73340.1 hypothetical protein BTA49_05110 [Pseudomonas mosselii]
MEFFRSLKIDASASFFVPVKATPIACLGTYPDVGLCQARSLRYEALRLIAQGTNPCTHRRHQRRTQNLAEQNT